MKQSYIEFEACLKGGSTKPVKFGPDGEAEIVLETDAGQMMKIVKVLGLLGQVFRVRIDIG